MIAIQRTVSPTAASARSSSSRKATTKKMTTRSAPVTSILSRSNNNNKNGAETKLAAIAMPSPEINEQTMTYNETGKWRENFDLAGWAKEIREVRSSRRELFFRRFFFSNGARDKDLSKQRV